METIEQSLRTNIVSVPMTIQKCNNVNQSVLDIDEECYVCYHTVQQNYYRCPTCKNAIHQKCYNTMVDYNIVSCGICRHPYRTFTINMLYRKPNMKWKSKEVMVFDYINYDTLTLLVPSIQKNRKICGIVSHGNLRAIGYIFVSNDFIGVVRLKGDKFYPFFKHKSLLFSVALFDSSKEFTKLEKKYNIYRANTDASE